MADSSKTPRFFSLRAFFFRMLPVMAVILIDVFFLALLDTLFYNKKRTLILDTADRWEEMFTHIDPIKKKMQEIKDRYPDPARFKEEAVRYLAENAPSILAGGHPWFRVRLTDEEKQVLYEYEDLNKLEQFNTWKNCFLSQSFHAMVASTIETVPRRPIRLAVYYATPPGWPEIERMVVRYWIYALLFIAGSGVFYGWLSRSVLRPLQRVGSAIERMIQSNRVALIRAPRHEIEKAFNRLAQNQREILFGLEIDGIVDTLHSQADDQVVVDQFMNAVIPAVQKIYPFTHVRVFRWLADERRLVPFENSTQSELNSPGAWPEENAPIQITPGGACAILLQSGEQTLGGILCEISRDNRFSSDELWQMSQEIKKQAENGLARASTRSRALTQERNRFGINLATNMGHDLTNIIASGKWDLDTIRRAHDLGIVSMDHSKGAIYLQAVEGLENNLHFLQDMVDIYRSFGYTRRPRYERVDLTALIRDVAQLFQLSSSQRITTQVLAHDPVEVEAEPRLLRMALFNLLANASQAIRNGMDHGKQGIIQIQTRLEGEGTVTVSVHDNGPGIRDKQGRLLSESEIGQIFQSGYSTKDQSSGGGLGLSWVKSIIEDFHAGSIQVYNRPQGGACFTLSFPVKTCHWPTDS